MNKKISFQGVEGAYSHLAVQEFFPGAEPPYPVKHLRLL